MDIHSRRNMTIFQLNVYFCLIQNGPNPNHIIGKQHYYLHVFDTYGVFQSKGQYQQWLPGLQLISALSKGWGLVTHYPNCAILSV